MPHARQVETVVEVDCFVEVVVSILSARIKFSQQLSCEEVEEGKENAVGVKGNRVSLTGMLMMTTKTECFKSHR